jgi:hypothetical protein
MHNFFIPYDSHIWQIPIIWDRFLTESTKDFEKQKSGYETALAKYNKDIQAWEQRQKDAPSTASSSKKRRKTDSQQDRKPEMPQEPCPRMHKDEPTNFLYLATSLKLYLGREVTEDMIARALSLFQDYLLGFKRVRVFISISPKLTERFMLIVVR